MEASRLEVGCGVFIRKCDQILLGKRGPASKSGAGLWALPGGLKEPGESLRYFARREVLEETGLLVRLLPADPLEVPGLLAATDHNCDIPGVDRLTLWILADWFMGSPENREPTKCCGWTWWSLKDVASIKGVEDSRSKQFQWTPLPLWRRILRPHFSQF